MPIFALFLLVVLCCFVESSENNKVHEVINSLCNELLNSIEWHIYVYNNLIKVLFAKTDNDGSVAADEQPATSLIRAKVLFRYYTTYPL